MKLNNKWHKKKLKYGKQLLSLFLQYLYVYLCQQEKIIYCIIYWPKTDLGLLQHIRWKAIIYCYKELYL